MIESIIILGFLEIFNLTLADCILIPVIAIKAIKLNNNTVIGKALAGTINRIKSIYANR